MFREKLSGRECFAPSARIVRPAEDGGIAEQGEMHDHRLAPFARARAVQFPPPVRDAGPAPRRRTVPSREHSPGPDGRGRSLPRRSYGAVPVPHVSKATASRTVASRRTSSASFSEAWACARDTSKANPEILCTMASTPTPTRVCRMCSSRSRITSVALASLACCASSTSRRQAQGKAAA